MQRPPERKAPPILFSRGGSDWIRRVTQKHNQLIGLRLTGDQKERLDQWAETEFVYSTLRLEGVDVKRTDAARAASEALDAARVAQDESATILLLISLRKAASVARANGKAANLTGALLLDLNSTYEVGFRRSGGDPSRSTKPVPPEHLPGLVEGACRWFSAESFAELNPIEQASIVLLRLIDLQPFDAANQRTALVAASLFTLRSDLPPIIIKPDMRDAYRNALGEGSRMNTQPMVELVAGAVEKSLEESIEGLRLHEI